jgi:transposase-like protein
MTTPSKKGVKSEAKVAAEADQKKAILDQVAQSSLPTKTILKELGISRSTYYSWLKRYEEEGMEGLMDSRSTLREEQVSESPGTGEPTPPVVGAEVPPEPTPVHQPSSATADKPEAEPEAPPVEPLRVEAKETEEIGVSVDTEESDAGGKRRGVGFYAFIVVFVLIVGLLLGISLHNYNTYELKKSGETLTLWKGKFAPRGSEVVSSFEPLVIGDSDVTKLTDRTFKSRDAVYRAVFAFFMNQAAAESAKGDSADPGKIGRLLDRAQGLVGSGIMGEGSMTLQRLELAQRRVAVAEASLRNTYKSALPVYQEALNRGLGDAAALKAQIQTMLTTLGLTTPGSVEPAGEEIKPVPAAGAAHGQQKPQIQKPAVPAKP